jgi:hypothetical protein
LNGTRKEDFDLQWVIVYSIKPHTENKRLAIERRCTMKSFTNTHAHLSKNHMVQRKR